MVAVALSRKLAASIPSYPVPEAGGWPLELTFLIDDGAFLGHHSQCWRTGVTGFSMLGKSYLKGYQLSLLTPCLLLY